MGGGTPRFHRMIRERALVAKKRFPVSERQRNTRTTTLSVSLDKADPVIDGMTIARGVRGKCHAGKEKLFRVGGLVLQCRKEETGELKRGTNANVTNRPVRTDLEGSKV